MKISLMNIMKRVLMGVVPKKPLVVLNKKYEFTDETKKYDGATLRRIRALKDFGNVKAGDVGGWIEKEENLSHERNCWVANEACVYGDAYVYGDVNVYGDACVFENVRVYGYAHICGHSQVYGNVHVAGHACISGNAHVYGNAHVFDNVCVYGDAVLKEKMSVQYSTCSIDLSTNLADSIRCQTGLHAFGDYVIAFKHVREDLSSLHDKNFKYVVGEWIEVNDPDMDNTVSCVSGLHVSNATYWEGRGGKVLLMCKVMLEDIIAVQEGKIRCKKLYVMDSSSEGVR